MTIRTRKALFYGLVALFFIVGTAVVFYAQGWRINPATFKTQKVGAIYVRSYPDGATITLDKKPVRNSSGFLSRGTLISNLFPENYSLALSAPGYDAWTENAPVSPTLVTEMKYAVLVPANASSVASAANVTSFFEADGNVVTQNASGTIARQASGALPSTTSTIIGHGTIVGHGSDFTTIVVRSPAGAYSAYDLPNATSTNLSSLFTKSSVTNKAIVAIAVNPYNGNNVIVQTALKLFSVDLRTGTMTAFRTAADGQTIESPLAISSSWLAWAQYHNAAGTSQVVVYDPFSDNVVDASLSLPGHIRGLQWIRSTELGILQEDGELFRYDIPSETLTKIADDVKYFYPTSDGAALAAQESRSIEVFSFTTSDYYRFNLPDMASVRSLTWYKDESHLFVTYPDHVGFLDLADLSLRNFTTVSAVSDGTAPTYDTQENALYLIDQGRKLLRFDFPN
ncbi:MAG: hypothetical protein P4L67_00935 [Candidatus Pacebacteria bacterium]|nr:hypothetical protein [Candidatus Paceibacterota bacterium]